VSRTVLIVDDEPDIREVAQLSLELTYGWNVLMAGSGEEAVASAREHVPDAILLDVMMPGMDGPATFERLRTHDATRSIPVVFLTAKAQAAEKRQLQELGAAGVLSKPFDPMRLAGDVAAALGWPQ
jgi:two-component system alkaline phosphatase synthesis response regulator PhoP